MAAGGFRAGVAVDAEDETFAPDAYFDDLTERIANRARWPDETFEKHSFMGRLLGSGFERTDPLFGSQERLGPRLAPSDLLHVVPADAFQSRAIEEKNFRISLP